MPRTIQIAASLPASSDRLFDMYLDPEIHAAITGAPVTIGVTPGSEFQAFDGMLSGTILQVMAKRLIVQSWRAGHWPTDVIDSTLILTFWPEGENSGRIELTHVNVADDDFAGVSQGWEEYYWVPWRNYLERK
ncbi:MAG: hypothetical protein EHM36_08605 [Deltaproteobacteria bacterium]|nr:MAG: hypothetical protein EHM36_08605 [Deltaproteobacteria bacterium]